jgi:pentatricopeptide repeat protein
MAMIVHEKATNDRSEIISIVNILPTCSSLKALPQIREIHGHAIQQVTFPDAFVGHALIDTYGKCGSMKDAVKAFNMMEFNGVYWNVMMTEYSQSGNFEAAFVIFKNMRQEKNIIKSGDLDCDCRVCSARMRPRGTQHFPTNVFFQVKANFFYNQLVLPWVHVLGVWNLMPTL